MAVTTRRAFLQLSSGFAVSTTLSAKILWAQQQSQAVSPAIERGEARDVKTFDILGFDCANFPGLKAVQAFRELYQYRVAGFYLNHSKPDGADKTWNKDVRTQLVNDAWGLFPIYFGSQADAPKKGLGTEHARFAAKRMTDCGFPLGSIVYLDVEPGKTEKQFLSYFEEWKAGLWKLGFYGGAYASYKMVDWLRPVTSAIWTYELAIGTMSPAEIDIMARQECASVEDLSLLFENGILGYDPKAHPHGIIRAGCIATQYLHCQKPPGVPPSPSPDGVYDLNSSLISDPSDQAEIGEKLDLKHLI